MTNLDNSKKLTEGLNHQDLVDCINQILLIDGYKSKMGDDRDMIVVTFRCSEQEVGKDLGGFIERGYKFVLDADSSVGQDETGKTPVFVEFERQTQNAKQLMRMLEDLLNLVEHKKWYFRYYKDQKIYPATYENLRKIVPWTPAEYDAWQDKKAQPTLENFFQNSLVDDVLVEGNKLTLGRHGATINMMIVDYIESEGSSMTEENQSNLRMFHQFTGFAGAVEMVNNTLVLETEDHSLFLKFING